MTRWWRFASWSPERCPHRCQSGGYKGKRCERDAGHKGLCWVVVGSYKHYWDPEFDGGGR